jgi:DNA primase
MHGALKEAMGYIPFLKGLADARGGDREVRERALRQSLGTIAGIEDPLRREYVLQEAAEVFGVQENLLRQAVEKEAAGARKRNRVFSRPVPGGTAPGPDRDVDKEQAGGVPGSDEAAANVQRRTGPQVRRSMAKVNAEPIEADMLSHILMDDSGEAARVFLADRGELEFSRPEARILADEIFAWKADGGAGHSPREFVLDRWNSSGDSAYRGFISQLISKEDRPESTDFIKVIKDCLDRLGQDSRLAGLRRGSVHTGE